MDFSKNIIIWYEENKRDLPWRKSKNPYHIWLSEIMLQQTQVSQGLPYFLKFIENFPTIFDLANADEDYILKLWQGLGYYSRARNLHFTAKYISTELNGEFPNKYNELIKLKGVGDYTASAIASICFNEPNAVVDGNVYRVLARYFGIKTAINSSEGIKEFKKLAQKLLDKTQSGVYNQAIMDFGAMHCKPKNPLCEDCFFTKNCVAFNTNSVSELPFKEKKNKVRNRYFNYLFVITSDEETILNQRVGKGIWQNLYEFPLIETKKPINKQQLADLKEFKNLFPEKIIISLFNDNDIIHKLSHQHLHTKFWIVKTSKVAVPTIQIKDLEKFAVPVLIENFLNTQEEF